MTTTTTTTAQAAAQDDLITIRKPTTSAEMLWLLKLAHLVISDVDKTLEETFAPAQPAAATQQAGEVRRAELVPGVMHCAKCKFQLNRVTLCVSDGNAYAGNNKTEPCPNGCGPLWPVTWEQEAKNCWKALEEMHERLMAAAAPQPTQPQAGAVPLDEARRLFDAGWKAAALFCDREDVVADGIIGFGACPQFEAAFSAAHGIKHGGQHD